MTDFYIDTDCGDISDFDSGHEVFDDYLRRQYDGSAIHYIVETETDRLIAYFSLVASALMTGDPASLNAASAIELKMFALDKRFQGTGIAPVLLEAVIDMISFYASEYVGAEFITLYSVPIDHVARLYERNGFQRVEGALTAFKSDFTEGCIPMFKAL